ncbi:hypothetical protein VPH35_037037 [Triticum aestivum]
MPEDEDPMPLDGNPHPLPGHDLPIEHNFVLPPYPAIGWNDLPPIPPPADDHVADDNWGNAVWGDEDNEHHANEQQPVQDQESMVIDQPALSDSDAHLDVPENVLQPVPGDDFVAPPVDVPENVLQAPEIDDAAPLVVVPELDLLPAPENVDEAPLAVNDWAIVPYHPPLIQFERIFVGVVKVVFGPVLPPELAWKRTFDSLLQFGPLMAKPMTMSFVDIEPIVLSKRSWALAFNDVQVLSKLQFVQALSASPYASQPVARKLFPSVDSVVSNSTVALDSGPASSVLEKTVSDEKFSFSAERQVKKGRRRKTMAPMPLVETSVRRCTRGSIKRDGFNPVFQELQSEPKKKKPRSKPFVVVPSEDAHQHGHGDNEEDPHGVPPPTPIPTLQRVGEDLGIAPEKLSVDRLMAEPSEDRPAASDV